MAYVNGNLRTVNGGAVSALDGIEIEILSRAISGHRADIVCTYFIEDGHKVELTHYNDEGRTGNEIYRFKRAEDLQHYHSRNYANGEGLPAKYSEKAQQLAEIHRKVFSV